MSNAVDFDVESIDGAMSEFKKNKASDLNGLTIEHFIYACPCLPLIISRLVSLMLHFSYVPEGLEEYRLWSQKL